MCGILFHLSHESWSPSTELLNVISARGPDSVYTETVKHRISDLSEPNNDCYLSFTSSVLSLRDHLSIQPKLCPTSGVILCWNGEAWKINGSELPSHQNDTEQVFKLLVHASRSDRPGENIVKALNSISGPYAFIYFDKPSSKLWFGRDCIGRRSLLLYERNGELTISSVGDGDKEKAWEEVESDGIYYLNLKAATREERLWRHRIPFVHAGIETMEELNQKMIYPFPPLNKSIPSSPPPATSYYTSELCALLRDSVRVRVQDIPLSPNLKNSPEIQNVSKVGILFSGGLDCTVLVRLIHELLPLTEPIDLINVAFENQRAVNARLTNTAGNRKVKRKQNCTNDVTSSPTFGVYTSLDPYELCPDRQTARSSLSELKQTCSNRKFNFVTVNVPYTAFLSERQNVINLIYPHNTEMDLSIAIAFYFAARGEGILEDEAEHITPYRTPCRILLSGLGADELFAGYGRHSTGFKKGGYRALLDELELDFTRLGKRNLGRDDRVISNWGKEVRYPFLDEDVVKWAMAVGIEGKCWFGESPVPDVPVRDGDGNGNGDIEGGKRVLRLVARQLGLQKVAMEKKRAVQFGARTAKMDRSLDGSGRKLKGTRILDELE